jgi:membrane protease YdiL (CAAX protease family)
LSESLEKLNRKDFHLVWVCVAVALLSLWVATKFFFQVFPEASIQFKVNRESSLPLAEDLLYKLGAASNPRDSGRPKDLSESPETSAPADLKSYHHAAIFDYDDTAKTFLERELGLQKANLIMGAEVRLWRWKHRWFRPLQKEEFQVDVSPKGEITRFQHLVAEDAPGADLAREEAQSLAESFLQGTLHHNLDKLEFTEVSTEKRPRRTDHLFSWKSKDFAVGDAQYRFSVRVQGNQIGEYEEFLKVPEEWLRGYQRLRSLNDTTATVDFIFLVLTLLAMLIVLILRVRHKDVQWRVAWYFGTTAFVLTFLSRLNNLPLSEFGYITTDSYGSFWVRILLNALIESGALAAGIFFITAGAEPLYRHHYGNRISLSNLFRWRGLRSKEFFIGSLVGITLTFFFFAYDCIFYLIAQKLGAWAPAEVPYSDLLNTRIPWAFVLLFGFGPAVSEEFICRMFSIPFFQQIFRFRWLAVWLASFIWGFGHANYPNQPFYIRGIEVGVGGLIVSLIFLRFGIVAPLVWHYSVDALYTAFLLLRSQNLYLMTTGGLSAGIMLIPFFIALMAYLRKQKFVTPETISNASQRVVAMPMEPSQPKIEQVPSVPYVPLSRRHRMILVGLSLVLLIPQLFRAERFGQFVDFNITRAQAREIAKHYLENMGIDWRLFHNTIYIDQSLDSVVAQYLLKYSNISVVNEIYSEKVKTYFWVARFYKPLEEEEYRVYIDPHDQSVIMFDHLISENASGMSLDKASALKLAEEFLSQKGVSLDSFELKETNSEKKKARQDYSFVWESKVDRIHEASIRLQAQIKGDQISNYSRFIKVPEEWRRERNKNTVTDTILEGIHIGLIVVLSGWGLWTFLRRARQGLIRWAPVLGLSGGLVILQLLGSLNTVPIWFQNYPTSQAPNIFIVSSISNLLISQIIQFLYFTLLLGLVSSLYPECWWTFRKQNRVRFSMDSLWLSLTILIGAFALTAISGTLVQHFHQVALLPAFDVPEEIDHFIPSISSLIRAVRSSLLYPSILLIVVYILRDVLKKPYTRALLLSFILLSLLPAEASGSGELLFALITRLALLLVILILVRYFFHQNFPAYLIATFLLSLLRSGNQLFSYSSTFLKWNGVALLALGGIVILKLGVEMAGHIAVQLRTQGGGQKGTDLWQQ